MENKYFNGKKLYGDHFSLSEMKKWFKDEQEGYSSLDNAYEDVYGYHALNKFHGFNFLKKKKFKKVLGFGAASGEEFLPIIDKIDEIYIIEPSKKLRVESIGGKKIHYIDPTVKGKINFKSNEFDLVTCFGVLHHIPNVTFVFKELNRILKKGGFLLLREPIVSMGDWSLPRKGLTIHERGIPLQFFNKLILKNNLKIISQKLILFPLLRRISYKKFRGGNSFLLVFLDYIFSFLFKYNYQYHAIKFWQKFTPQSVFFVLEKR